MLALLLMASKGSAQVSAVVIDMQTGLPVRDVNVYTNKNYETKTDWHGRFNLPYDFESITISNFDYLQRVLKRDELTDTIGIVPMAHMLEGVTIWGNRPNYAQRFHVNKDDLKLAAPHPSGMNILGLINNLFNAKKIKQHEKLMDVLKNY